MTAVYIISVIILLIAVILVLPVKILISGNGKKISFSVKLSFIKLFPNNSKKGKDNNTDKKKLKKGEDKNKNPFIKATDIIKKVSDNTELIKCVFEGLKKFLKHLKVSRLFADICVSDDDAADSAIYYGIICSTVYPFVGFLQSVIDVKNPDIRISCDYNGNSHLIFNVVASLRIVYFIIFAVSFFEHFIKLKRRIKTK